MGEITDAPSGFIGDHSLLPFLREDIHLRRLSKYRIDLAAESGISSSVDLDGVFLWTGEPHLVFFCGESSHIPVDLQEALGADGSYYTVFGRSFFSEGDGADSISGRILEMVGRHFNEEDGKFLFPDGVNVNFVDVRPEKESARYRVYERGLNRETLACGTGATAVGAAAHYLGLPTNCTRFLITPSQVRAVAERVGREDSFGSLIVEKVGGEWVLEGPVNRVFDGELPTPEWRRRPR